MPLKRYGADCALIVVDVQNSFCPGGALAVPGGDEVVPLINHLALLFENVVLTQDWHPAGHVSFAGSHPGSKPFQTIDLPYGPQTLWPAHCVQGSVGADFHPELETQHARLIVRKGGNPQVDSYSAFVEADRATRTGLAGYLDALGVKKVWLAGLATDFCVAWSAIDARAAGFETFVVEDACRAIDIDGSLADAWMKMRQAGVKRLRSDEV
ncbi:bifunctional nicotinamidase/pyrazinamidase [Chromobacterium subtsugae]|uniref:nicotinamidase n=1 Tax=Chromobacterium subtsugae TaxID=251747 RepID=A0ABS7F9K0_9NEIS|nr:MULTISPECIES: bifunctional nicotinamidase/pyrazinamidase [Chromobacterium]KUM02591.1 bifunctional pyrazinamidase/nicotinamidase [Chromobacterium subtsugae]KZE87977.1 bifunctional pyrazinamidase/nicotinamidase [Chromobacterium sp. F49]MBW7565474.1 bifunctional nicotinamidase/pyrazinamidase [Chromobacterium subtsugae]MBW8286676.1 bifunctional nicotinamidase/pyrazinamidase [Chromobacterium subtsugae]OBU84640.1 bifunctional pyrazinamidase/nicotinamidase [Chromobacterium subtsugae]